MMLALMAGAMAFTACSNDDILENIENNEVAEAPSQLKPMTFSAVQEGQGTRAAIDGLDINWTAGDKISIFDGATENDGVQMFELATGAGETSATFAGSAADAATYYALYPYAVGSVSRTATEEDAAAAAGSYSNMLEMWGEYIGWGYEDMVQDDMDYFDISPENQAIIFAFLKGQNITAPGVQLDGSNIKNVVIPAEQTATAGSADPTAMIMVAKGDDKDALEFKNVCAYVKVTPQFNCYAIALISKGNENLAGKMTVDCSGENPTTTVTANGTNAVYLVGTITAGNAYYIAVRPESLASGFTIEFLTADKNTYYARSTSKTLALARSNVKNLGEFSTSGTWTHNGLATNGTDNGHSWTLITPTFKLATAPAGKFKFAEIPDWGSNWVLPSAEEFSDLRTNGYFTRNNDRTAIQIQGAGILRYIEVAAITTEVDFPYWTSTSYDSDYQMVLDFGQTSPIRCLKTNARCAIFKYNN